MAGTLRWEYDLSKELSIVWGHGEHIHGGLEIHTLWMVISDGNVPDTSCVMAGGQPGWVSNGVCNSCADLAVGGICEACSENPNRPATGMCTRAGPGGFVLLSNFLAYSLDLDYVCKENQSQWEEDWLPGACCAAGLAVSPITGVCEGELPPERTLDLSGVTVVGWCVYINRVEYCPVGNVLDIEFRLGARHSVICDLSALKTVDGDAEIALPDFDAGRFHLDLSSLDWVKNNFGATQAYQNTSEFSIDFAMYVI